MKRLVFGLMVSGAMACGPKVEVRTAPAQPAQTAIQLTNGLSQAVNVYVNYNGNDQFIQQVRANTALRLPVTGVPSGATVSLRATTIDGTRSFDMRNIVLSGTVNFSVP